MPSQCGFPSVRRWGMQVNSQSAALVLNTMACVCNCFDCFSDHIRSETASSHRLVQTSTLPPCECDITTFKAHVLCLSAFFEHSAQKTVEELYDRAIQLANTHSAMQRRFTNGIHVREHSSSQLCGMLMHIYIYICHEPVRCCSIEHHTHVWA